jgi:predicted nucleotidyltransferase component of viral defense system
VSGNLAASIHARLLNRAKARGDEFNLVLTRYAVERFLYRLSTLPAGRNFCLKGALLFDLWFDEPHRPTHDADFLGFGLQNAGALTRTMREACGVATEDGMVFDAASITVEEIREEARYGGLRVRLVGMLGKARSTVQVDVGYGDAITPGPEEAVYPVMLADLPPPRLQVYPRATVIAEKLEAIVNLGMTNSRMKDFYDVRALAREGGHDAALIGDAIKATFQRRNTPLPEGTPIGLSDEFARDGTKRAQWKGFLNKNRLGELTLDEVVEDVRRFLEAPLAHARKQSAMP